MARQSHLLSQLRALLEGLDDDALVTVSSAGLLRRARKDLESLTPKVTESEGAGSLQVDLGTHQVVFDSRGLAHARCTCPAKTTCQHVLAAWLHLRMLSTEPGEATEDLVGELMGISTEALIEFAGLAAMREALQAVESSELPALEIASQLKIRLPHPPVELRYAGGGLDAFILDYRGKRREKLIVQAVLAFQKANGAAAPVLPASGRKRRVGTTTTAVTRAAPAPLLTQVLATLTECMKLGALHLSENMAERLLSQAAAAEGADLHRLALALTRLAHHIDLQLGLNAGTSSAALLDELARTYALAAAIHNTRGVVPALWGESRSEYEDIPRLELIGVGAEPWRTASGYTGLTLLLWSPAHKRWYSATDSRPAGMLGFDPLQRYRAAGPWAGCNSPAQACGARLTLTHARANRAGRLSLSESTTARIFGLAQWPEFSGREYDCWSGLQAAIQADASGVGLAEPDPHAGYVVLRPRKWLHAKFDSTTQELYRQIVDENGDLLSLCVPYSSLASHAIERLEALRPGPDAKLLARVQRIRSRLVVRPISLLQQGRADNLFLDEGPRLSVADTLAGKLYDFLKGKRDEPAANAAPIRQDATQTRLRALEDEILRLAEKGLAGLPEDAARIEQLEEELRGGGIDLLPAGPAGVAVDDLPERLLRLKHCLMVVRELQS
jgi:hypothetical protein